jgi:hypothetical protein
MCLEGIQFGLPESSVFVDPSVDFREAVGPERIVSVPAFLPDAHEPGLPEDAEMAGHPGLADLRERPTQLPRGPFATGEEVEYLSPSRIGEGRKDVSFHRTGPRHNERINPVLPRGACTPQRAPQRTCVPGHS